ncbi:unnamed protein product [Thlaspi arvense]|uniref:Uncharacterized protein n=1 Tax=Thlaspi arvense TaxID=13288 RepID=A0AAU9T6I0_THLAR|nr:unnamed protein product [Thlaspi arvense]
MAFPRGLWLLDFVLHPLFTRPLSPFAPPSSIYRAEASDHPTPPHPLTAGAGAAGTYNAGTWSYNVLADYAISFADLKRPSLMVERAEGKRCHITIDQKMFCDLVYCRQSCFSGYNGVGKCFDDPKVAGSANCGCTYNC